MVLGDASGSTEAIVGPSGGFPKMISILNATPSSLCTAKMAYAKRLTELSVPQMHGLISQTLKHARFGLIQS